MISKFYAPLLKKRAELENDERGFTLIELLVVVLIIGILAAIAIPVFLGQQDAAKNSAAQADLATARTAYVSYLVSNAALGDSPSTIPQALKDFGWPTGVTLKKGAAATFCIQNNAAPVWSTLATSNTPVNAPCA
jgi:type IV pilus assembly protein PilA